MIRIDQESFQKYLVDYRRDGIPYTLYTSNLSSKLVSALGPVIYTGNPITHKEMGFVNKVRYALEKSVDEKIKTVPRRYRKATYFKINALAVGFEYTGAVEIDINNAYWRTALLLGFITEELYQAGLLETKQARLIALGQLAKRQSVFSFDGKTVRQLADIVDAKKEYAWDLICRGTGDVLLSISRQTDYLFFWVDAIFVPFSDAGKVKYLLHAAGYNYKTIKINGIEVWKRQLIVHNTIGDPKIFNVNQNYKFLP